MTLTRNIPVRFAQGVLHVNIIVMKPDLGVETGGHDREAASVSADEHLKPLLPGGFVDQVSDEVPEVGGDAHLVLHLLLVPLLGLRSL